MWVSQQQCIYSRSLSQGVGVAVGSDVFQSQFAMQFAKYETIAGNATELARDAAKVSLKTITRY